MATRLLHRLVWAYEACRRRIRARKGMPDLSRFFQIPLVAHSFPASALLVMFTAALFANLLLATAALAAPKGRLGNRINRRRGAHQSKPLQVSEGPAATASNSSHVEYSSNWAGAVVTVSAVRSGVFLLLSICGT